MDILEFVLGVGVAFLSHEGGHEIAGRGDVDWRGSKWYCSAPCGGQRIAAAGYYSQIVVSETVARVFDEAEYKSFRQGIRAFNVVQPMLHVMGRDGDLDNFGESDRRRMRGVLLVFSVYSAIQFLKESN